MFLGGQSPIPNPCTASLPLPPRRASKVLIKSETDVSMYEQYGNTRCYIVLQSFFYFNPTISWYGSEMVVIFTMLSPCPSGSMYDLSICRCFSLFLLVLLVFLHPVALSKRFCHGSLFSLFGLLFECLIAWADCDCLSFWFLSHTLQQTLLWQASLFLSQQIPGAEFDL